MWELDYKESWAPKNWCFWTVVLEKTLESPLDSKEIHPVYPKGDQSWAFTGRTDVEAETPILGYLMRRADSFEKTLMLGKIEGRRRRGRQRMRWLDHITDSMDMCLSRLGSWWWTGKPSVLLSVGSQRVRHNWVTELNWMPRSCTFVACGSVHLIWALFGNILNLSILRCTGGANGKPRLTLPIQET